MTGDDLSGHRLVVLELVRTGVVDRAAFVDVERTRAGVDDRARVVQQAVKHFVNSAAEGNGAAIGKAGPTPVEQASGPLKRHHAEGCAGSSYRERAAGEFDGRCPGDYSVKGANVGACTTADQIEHASRGEYERIRACAIDHGSSQCQGPCLDLEAAGVAGKPSN